MSEKVELDVEWVRGQIGKYWSMEAEDDPWGSPDRNRTHRITCRAIALAYGALLSKHNVTHSGKGERARYEESTRKQFLTPPAD